MLKIGKACLVKISGAENKTVEFRVHSNTSGKYKGEDQGAENGGSFSIGNGHGMQPREENVVVPKEFDLSGVLHSLMRYQAISLCAILVLHLVPNSTRFV